MTPAHPESATAEQQREVLEAAEFMADRLTDFEYELLDDDVARMFFGHVMPALERLRAAILQAKETNNA